MPFSLLLQGYPSRDIPLTRVQGTAVQGMFLELLKAVDPAVTQRLHEDSRYRPYTVSPLGMGKRQQRFQSFIQPRGRFLKKETPCYLRITLLEDDLFPTFDRYFRGQNVPSFSLGRTEFVMTGIEDEGPRPQGQEWTQYLRYGELINRSSRSNRKITLQFLTPTSFRRGDRDFPLPDPRLVFQNYQRRFKEFHDYAFLENFADLVERHTGIARLDSLRTQLIKTKNVPIVGFTGTVSYEIDPKAPPELIFQMNLLAHYAFFCGTGKKTTVGMGQTVCTNGNR